MVRAILFDLDDTLFDHRASAADALRRIQHAHACFLAAPFAAFEAHHSRLLEEIHPEVLGGRLGIDDARRERFRRLFALFGVAADAARCDAAARLYRRAYLDARRATRGAAPLLGAVRARGAAVAVVSNNLEDEQREKLAHCGLSDLVDALVVSETVGVAKPDPAIFAAALTALAVDAGESVMLGDSWTADILGAAAAGITPVWFNPLRLPPPAAAPAVRQLHALEPADEAAAVLFGGGGG